MEISFRSKEIRLLCESELDAHEVLGRFVGSQLFNRIADLVAAESIRDLVAVRPVNGANEELFIGLGTTHRMVLRANHLRNPMLADGMGVDWSKVNRVLIFRIEPND